MVIAGNLESDCVQVSEPHKTKFGGSESDQPMMPWNQLIIPIGGASSKILVKSCICCLLGRLVQSSHERIMVCAKPILAARWPGVRFRSFRLDRIQSPSVCTFSANGI